MKEKIENAYLLSVASCQHWLAEHSYVPKAMFLGAACLAVAEPAVASLGGIATNVKRDTVQIVESMKYLLYAGGVGSVAIGVNNGIKKSKGDNQVTTGSIFGYGLGGVALSMVTWLVTQGAQTLGGSGAENQINNLP